MANETRKKGTASQAHKSHHDPDCKPEDWISGAEFCDRLLVILADFRAKCEQDKAMDDRFSPWIWISRFRAFMREHPYGEP